MIAVEDDGKGLDHDAIADKARRLGWLAPDATPGPEQLHAFIFQPGFSTRSQANAISGRGVGMDVVVAKVSKLRGTIDLTSQPGHGSRVTLRLPSQLALEPALIVRVAGQGLAVPASQIECVQPFEPGVPSSGCPSDERGISTAPSSSACPTVLVRDQAVPVVFACDTLGISRVTSPPWSMLVVVKTGSRNIGLVVDTIERAEDLVIKPLGALLAGHPLISGTSLSINGELISVLNPPGLERWLSLRNVSEKVPALARTQTQEPRRSVRGEGATVLVVDDSISVRRKMVRQLRGLGLDVHEVADGKEALSRLRSSSYGLVVTDLEMPQLDGFALLAEMKRSAAAGVDPRGCGQYLGRRGDSAARARARGTGLAFQAGRSPRARADRRTVPTGSGAIEKLRRANEGENAMDKPLILIIDDSHTIRKMVECHLSQAGYRVAMAVDADQGLEMARSISPRLILLDHQLPGTTGDDVCRRLLEGETTARIPVIISSAMRNRAYARYTEYPNVVDQIPKPFTPELLKSGVANALQMGEMVVQSQRTGCAMPEAVGEVDNAILEGKTEPFSLRALLDFLNNCQQAGRLTLEAGKHRVRWALAGGRVQAVYSPTLGPDSLEDHCPPSFPTSRRSGAHLGRATRCIDGRAGQAARAKSFGPQKAPSLAAFPGVGNDLSRHDRRAGKIRLRAGDDITADVSGVPSADERAGPGR